MSNLNRPQPPKPLMKQHSLPSDLTRDKAWLRKQKRQPSHRHLHRSKSCITNEDIDELKGCFDLGFGFEPDSPDFNPSLSKTIPALDLYCAVHRQHTNHLSRTSSLASESDVSNSNSTTTIVNSITETSPSPWEGNGSNSSSTTIVNKGDDEKTMKKKLKQWAKVVACSVRQSSGEPN
ncbi:hypothetical protein V5N11_020635 [Cardamine amara subsp. amara]|uniref:Uncharacterized protein n=1 Tax=Cardamine amara subsp. amara TaxID=228776 RepID=A0ABD0Z202_CARAN